MQPETKSSATMGRKKRKSGFEISNPPVGLAVTDVLDPAEVSSLEFVQYLHGLFWPQLHVIEMFQKP